MNKLIPLALLSLMSTAALAENREVAVDCVPARMFAGSANGSSSWMPCGVFSLRE
jgi:hypothetical protein